MVQRVEASRRAAFGLGLMLGAVLHASPSAAQAPPVVAVEGTSLTITPQEEGALPRRFALGCEVVAHRVDPAEGDAQGHWLHVACTERVLRIELTTAGAVVVEDVVLAQPVVGSHDTPTDTWLEFADGSARSIRVLASLPVASAHPTSAGGAPPLGPVPPAPDASAYAAPQPPPGAPRERATVVGRVLEVRADQRACVVDFGSEQGLHEGDRVVFSAAELSLDDEDVVVGRVRSVTSTTALVVLPYNARVEQGQRAELGDRYSRTSRPRLGEWPYRASLRLSMRPALVLGNLGVTAALDAEGVVHAGVGVFGVRAMPTGFSTGRRDPEYGGVYSYGDSGANFGFGGGYVLGGVDFGFLSVALGVGVAATHREDGRDVLRSQTVLTLPFRLRVGTEDGVHGEVTQLIAYQAHELRWLGVEVRAQMPVGPIWLFADGSGGLMPAFHGVVGARFPLRGNGEPGSWSLRVGAGAAGVTSRSPSQELRVGPALHLGLDARL